MVELPYSAEGIILSSDKYRERDRMLAIYTGEFGKIRAVSRGSRKTASKTSPHLEPLNYVNLMLVPGKTFINVTGSSEIKNFRNLRKSGAYTLAALYLAELVGGATPENLSDKRIFCLLADLLGYLDKAPAKRTDRHGTRLKISEVILTFKLKLLDYLGLRPAEIEKMSLDILRMLEDDFSELESADWKKLPKEKLEKSLNYELSDIIDYSLLSYSASFFKNY